MYVHYNYFKFFVYKWDVELHLAHDPDLQFFLC